MATTDTETTAKPKIGAKDRKHIHVKVYSPYKVYFDGLAQSMSAINETGPFDVLPLHRNFLTLLNEGDITIRTDIGEEKVSINRGIMHVKANEAVVFLDV